MNKITSKVTLLASVLAVAGMFVVPAVRAADDAEKAAILKADPSLEAVLAKVEEAMKAKGEGKEKGKKKKAK
jgi:hypothetical protein